MFQVDQVLNTLQVVSISWGRSDRSDPGICSSAVLMSRSLGSSRCRTSFRPASCSGRSGQNAVWHRDLPFNRRSCGSHQWLDDNNAARNAARCDACNEFYSFWRCAGLHRRRAAWNSLARIPCLWPGTTAWAAGEHALLAGNCPRYGLVNSEDDIRTPTLCRRC